MEVVEIRVCLATGILEGASSRAGYYYPTIEFHLQRLGVYPNREEFSS
jgi:hypothetical protein